VKARAGFTLIEMLVVLACVAIIMPLAGSMIYLLMRAQTDSATALAEETLLSRFDQRFRDDVHAAKRATTSDAGGNAGARLSLTIDSPRTVEYAVAPTGAISRAVHSGSKTERREEFRLAAFTSRFESAADGREVAVIHQPGPIVRSSADKTKTSPIIPTTRSAAVIRVAAVIGRDHRFESNSSSSSVNQPRASHSPSSLPPSSAPAAPVTKRPKKAPRP
jgi:prepilin-type N-terminal cleavage/methylation domain-containing protein